ncbi:tetratricopeptide repeat protein [Meridianimarinicoccus aquatilis]|uniref:Tetratricopeptide repeat protein n=1 Tax=Meridianimarinicoccus aquatilis TaxID=2552766 RepID=A0A4R6AQE7_9RHOB|nr:tetratricopeptide repeat protein [Fluviibacterium aquatile]
MIRYRRHILRLLPSIFALALCAQIAGPVHAFGTSGSYLAARHASFESNFSVAAEYYTRALALDPGNPGLMEAVISSNINLGEVARGFPVAKRMIDGGLRSQIANMAALGQLASEGNFEALSETLKTEETVGVLVDGLALAWAEYGAGQVTEALAKFDEVSGEQGLKSFALYHKALALAVAGDFEGADEILSGRADGPLQMSPRGILAHVQVLVQLDRRDDAIELIEMAFGDNASPEFEMLADDLRSGADIPYSVVTNAAEGIGDVFHAVASALVNESAPGYTLLYARMAEFLNPGNIDATLLSAQLLEDLEQYELATKTYDRVPQDHPAFVNAEIGRAEALLDDGRTEGAVEALTQLAQRFPEMRIVQYRLGDMLRSLDRHAEASEAYDRTVALSGEPEQSDWPLYFARGISFERTDRWDDAEADFRLALELQPGQPQVLNYLGYSLVELGRNLDEALGMIERAVAARPDDGYITDSLGWILYRMGKYDEAIVHMERAVELMPVDPIINDHLGDVLWAVGRRVEAQFQWHRAMSFDPEPEEAERIRRKLEVGLDAVLEEEGADPLAVAEDG